MKAINKKLAQQIVDAVKDICGYHINFINNQGIIIASTDDHRIGTYHEIGFQAAQTGMIKEVMNNMHFSGTQKGLNLPIAYNGIIVAVIGISGEPEKVGKYAHLAERITRLLIRERELTEYDYTQREKKHYVLQSLLDGDNLNTNYLIDCLAEFGISITAKMRMILIKGKDSDDIANHAITEQKINQLFQRVGIILYSYRYPNEYIAVIEEGLFIRNEYLLKSFAREFQEMMQIGIGRSAFLYQMTGSYENAVIALKSAKLGGDNFAIFDRLDLEMILGHVDIKTRHQYLGKVVSQLTEEDLLMLSIYYEEDMSLVRTSQRLFVHKNTLQQRMNKMYHLCGYNPRKFKDAVVLYLGLKLAELI